MKNRLLFSVLGASLIAFHLAGAEEPPLEVAPAPTAVITDPGEGAGGMSLLTRLPVHLSLSVHGGYDDNLLSGSGQGSWFTDEGADLSYKLSTERTKITLDSGAHIIYYPDQTSGAQTNDVNIYLNSSIIYHLSSRLELDATVFAAYQTEPTFGSDVGVENQRANYFQTFDSLSATYLWSSRFSTVTGDKFQRVDYVSSSLGTSLNRFDNTISEQFKFNILPHGIVPVGEYRFEIVDYDSSLRNSTTHYALAGFDEAFSSQLNATVRGGATFRFYNDDGSRIDPYFEGTLSYSGAHHSSLNWTTSYGVEEPNSAQILSRTTFRTGLELKCNLSPRISATVDGFYHHDQNEGFNSGGTTGSVTPGFSEDAFDVSAGVRYAIRGYLTFDLSVEHSEINSGESSRDYSRNRYSAGLTFTY